MDLPAIYNRVILSGGLFFLIVALSFGISILSTVLVNFMQLVEPPVSERCLCGNSSRFWAVKMQCLFVAWRKFYCISVGQNNGGGGGDDDDDE